MRLVYCLLSPTFGMHQYTADLANRMAQHFDVHVITTTGVPVDRYSPDIHIHTPTTLTNTGLSMEGLRLRGLVQYVRCLEKLAPGVVHMTGPHLWNPFIAGWLRLRKIPVIHSIHDLEPHSDANQRHLLKFWNQLIIRLSGRIMVHGKLTKERLVKSGISSNDVVLLQLLHLFLSFNRVQQLDADLGPVRYDGNILFFGRIERYKGVRTLIRAFQRFREDNLTGFSPDIKLIIAGEGDLPSELYETLPEGIDIINTRIDDELAEALFRDSSLVVLPYNDATQSALVAAAYYFHKPVVVTDCGSLPEYVRDGISGVVIPASDVAALTDAFKQLLGNPAKLRSMGDAGRNWYDEQRKLDGQLLKNLYVSYHVTS